LLFDATHEESSLELMLLYSLFLKCKTLSNDDLRDYILPQKKLHGENGFLTTKTMPKKENTAENNKQ